MTWNGAIAAVENRIIVPITVISAMTMKKRLPSFVWKKDKVLETKVSVLQGEIRPLKWALFGSFS